MNSQQKYLLGQFLKKYGKRVSRFIPDSLFYNYLNNSIYEPRIKHLGIFNDNFPLFETVFFEVRTKCNGSCPFCAASIENESREDTSMPKELYIKIINQLKTIGFGGRIAYHVNNDPLIFPDLPDFVSYARENLPKAWIQILTNGKALNPKKAEHLLAAGINELTVNNYDDDFTKEIPHRIQKIYDTILPIFYRKEQIKTGHGPCDKSGEIFRFNIIRTKINIVKSSRAGTSPNKKIEMTSPRGFCEYPFTQLNITTDGRVSKCCADLYFSDPMGDLKEERLLDIWYGDKFNRARKHLLAGRREQIGTCRKCDFIGVRRYYSWGAKIFRIIQG